MKTFHKILLPLALVLVFPGCTKERQEGEAGTRGKAGVIYTFTAGELPGLKTSVSAEGKVSWSAGDRIAVWDGRSQAYCTFTSESGNGIFSFEGTEGMEYAFTEAVYPASIASAPGKVILPAVLSEAEASRGGVAPMAATVGEGAKTLSFTHLGAILQLDIRSLPAEATSVVISSKGTALSGEFPVKDGTLEGGIAQGEGEDLGDGGSLSVKSGEIHSAAGDGSVTVNVSSGETRDIRLYIPLPVGGYDLDISVLAGENTLFARTTANLKDVARAKLMKLDLKTVNLSAAVSSSSTKASFNDAGRFSWNPGDDMAVWDSKGSGFVTFTTPVGSGRFYALTPQEVVFEGEAFHPASIAKAPGTVSLSGAGIPMRATVTQGSNQLSFRHIGALVRVHLRNIPSDAVSLVLSATGTSLTGDFTLDGDRWTQSGTGGEIVLPLNPSESTTVSALFAVPTGAYTLGYTLLAAGGPVLTRTTDGTATFERAYVYSFPSEDINPGGTAVEAQVPLESLSIETDDSHWR